MTPTEAAALLTIAASFDNRKPDAEAAKAWSIALNGLTFVDCRDAIVEHYSATTTWLMPAHVRTIVKRVRSKRIAEDADYNPPPELDPDRTGDYARWLVAAREAAADGAPMPEVPPAAIRGRNIVGELGQVGSPMPSEVRAAVAEGKAAGTQAEAAKRALRAAKAERLAKAREADRAARGVGRGESDVA